MQSIFGYNILMGKSLKIPSTKGGFPTPTRRPDSSPGASRLGHNYNNNGSEQIAYRAPGEPKRLRKAYRFFNSEMTSSGSFFSHRVDQKEEGITDTLNAADENCETEKFGW